MYIKDYNFQFYFIKINTNIKIEIYNSLYIYILKVYMIINLQT